MVNFTIIQLQLQSGFKHASVLQRADHYYLFCLSKSNYMLISTSYTARHVRFLYKTIK